MIAEIYRKTNKYIERSEDELTGNFFGCLRYIPFNKGLKQVLKNSVYPTNLSSIFDNIDVEQWNENIYFWPKEKEAEPDIILSFDNVVIAIEAKFMSRFSSDDGPDYNTQQPSLNQLIRESQTLNRIAGDREKLLLLIAPEESAHKIYSDVTSKNILDNVIFGCATWQNILVYLEHIEANKYEKTIINDLIALLKSKGFERFKDFNNAETTVLTNELWMFDMPFSFSAGQSIERGIYYEFG